MGRMGTVFDLAKVEESEWSPLFFEAKVWESTRRNRGQRGKPIWNGTGDVLKTSSGRILVFLNL